MFDSPSGTTKEVNLPEVSSADLSTFLSAITQTQPPTGLTVTETTKAINLLCRYECNDAARRTLFHNAKHLEAEELFEASALASRLNDIMSGCRVLAQGYTWYYSDPDNKGNDPEEPSLCPDSERRPWGAHEAARIQPSWIWALSLATTAVDRMPQPKTTLENLRMDKTYWRSMVGHFMCNLVQ
jgi:hypothetical protein